MGVRLLNVRKPVSTHTLRSLMVLIAFRGKAKQAKIVTISLIDVAFIRCFAV